MGFKGASCSANAAADKNWPGGVGGGLSRVKAGASEYKSVQNGNKAGGTTGAKGGATRTTENGNTGQGGMQGTLAHHSNKSLC